MELSVLKKIVYLTVLLGIIAGALYWYNNKQVGLPLVDETTNLQEDLKTLQSNTLSSNNLEDTSSIGLLLKDFILSQGEKGYTLWRLKATAGNMSKINNVFIVETPALTYNMEDGSLLTVISHKGDIDQNDKTMRFIDDVVVTHSDQKITGELLVYDGNTKTMTFPEQAHFKDPQVSGAADTIIWHIDSKVIEGTGNVSVTFDSNDMVKKKPKK